MSSQDEHEARSLDVLGAPWPHVHAWLDHYFDEVSGVAHRIVLHHRRGIELGVATFGESARPALELHIEDDFEIIPETPDEVAQMVGEQGLLSFEQAELLLPIIVKLWPNIECSVRKYVRTE